MVKFQMAFLFIYLFEIRKKKKKKRKEGKTEKKTFGPNDFLLSRTIGLQTRVTITWRALILTSGSTENFSDDLVSQKN